jgi:hypothetical protein
MVFSESYNPWREPRCGRLRGAADDQRAVQQAVRAGRRAGRSLPSSGSRRRPLNAKALGIERSCTIS